MQLGRTIIFPALLVNFLDTSTATSNFIINYKEELLYLTKNSVYLYNIPMFKLSQNKKKLTGFIFSFLTSSAIAQVPVINSFTPISGSVGSSVTISGSNFNATPANNIVYFGASKATVTAASATSLDVTVPGGAGYETISVNVNGFTASSSLKFTTSFGGGVILYPNSFELGWLGIGVFSAPNSWAIADLDGDGKPDIGTDEHFVWPFVTFDTIALYRNTSANGILSYGPKFNLDTLWPNGNESIFLKDIDGDGKPDPATFSPGNYLNVYRNTSVPGTLSFAPEVKINWSAPQEVFWGDFDNDGRTDIALLNNNYLGIFLNSSSIGNISFNPVEAYSVTSVTKVKTADIDEDGKLDLIVVAGTTLHVLKNTSSTGSLSFSSFDLPLLTQPNNLFIGDLNGDQNEDIVSLETNGFSIFKNMSTPGNPGFAAREDRTINGYTPNFNNFNFNDIDGDAKPDLIGKVNFDSMGIFKNTSAGGNISFADYTGYPAVPGASFGTNLVGFADLNLDGKSEILISQAYDFLNTIAYLKNRAGEPRLNSFTPTSGGAGTTIGISGYNLSTTNAITIGGIPVNSFTVINADSVSAIVPAGVLGTIVLTTLYGVDSIKAFNTPVINLISPTHGGPFTTVNIKGLNFTGITAVMFGGVPGVPAASFTITSDTAIIAVVSDSIPAGYLPVTITNSFGSDSKNGFYFDKPNKIELCPATASTSFTVSGGGYTYKKWQVYNGSAYVDIVDDINYSGSNTNTLQLNNIPSSWYGNNYQFLYGNDLSSLSILNQGHFVIKFVNRWNGSASTAWEDPANWSCGTLPDSNTDVVINSGANIILNSNTTIRSLVISPGATLTIATGVNLTVLH